MYNVLIVDDEPSILSGLKTLINWEEYGLEVTALASCFSEALRVLKSMDIHILLTDIVMPGMSGLELIREAYKINPEIKAIILSGHDDFALVKEALKLGVENYFLKPISIDELTETIRCITLKLETRHVSIIKPKDIYRENLLNRWVTNSSYLFDIVEKGKVVDLSITNNEFIVIIVRIIEMNTLEDKYTLCYSITNQITTGLDNYLNCITFVDTDLDIVLIFSGNEIIKKTGEIRNKLWLIYSDIQRYHNIPMFITIGKMQSGYQNVYLCYNSAKDMQNYSMVVFNTCTIYDDDMVIMARYPLKLLKIDLDDFYALLNNNNKERCLAFLCNVQKTVMTCSVSIQGSKSIAIEILYCLSKAIVQQHLVSSQSNQLLSSFTNVLIIDNNEALFKKIDIILNKYLDITIKKEQSISPIIKRLIQHIQSNSANDLSLKILADRFSMNASYLGQLFKNEVGQVFSNYLNEVRIEKAKVLLNSTKLNVNDISKQVGYSSQGYFFTVFKKNCGVSPVEFREQHRNYISYTLP